MKLNEVFELDSSKEAIQELANIVTKAREAYGNTDKVISAPEITTINGLEDLAMLSDESKLAIAESEVGSIRIIAVEYTKSFDGAILDRKIEELIAISPILANITAKVESAYL
jgi:hypothetical protein